MKTFRGEPYICIRDYYIHKVTGKWMAGSKGLNMTLVEWQALKAIMGEVDAALKPFEERLKVEGSQ